MEKPTLSKDDISCSGKNEKDTSSLKANTPLKAESGNIQYGGIDNDTKVLISKISKKKSCLSIFQYLSTLTIEPFFFLFLAGYIMELTCLPKMIMDKGCLNYFNYSKEICKNTSHHEDEKVQLEILANNYMLYIKLFSFVGAFTMIFVVPWSDKYGRKLPLFLACLGTVLSDLGFVMCVVKFESDLFYLVLSRIPSELFGGFICILTIVFSHSSEVSTENSRTRKYTTVEIAMSLGMSLGALVGGTLLRYYGNLSVFLTATVLHSCCLLWVVFCIEETRGLDATATWKEKIKDFFKTDNFVKGFQAFKRRRENHGRAFILLFLGSMCIIVLTYESFMSIGFTYMHDLYNWDPMTYSSANTIFGISQLVLLLICIPTLLRKYKVSDFTLGIIGSVSLMLKFSLLAFAHVGVYIFYLGNALGGFSGLSTLSIRSCISKTVDKDELGIIFSFLATCEAIFPLVGTLLITKVFNATIKIHPSITYLMTVYFLLLPVGTFALGYRLMKKRQHSRLRVQVD